MKRAPLQELQGTAASARDCDASGPTGKFIVSAWDDAYRALPPGKHVGMSHWDAEAGRPQVCGKVSGAAIQSFIEDSPASAAPEPDAA